MRKSIISGTESQQESVLSGLSSISRIFQGSDSDLCKEMLQGNFIKFFEELSPALNCKPPDAVYRISGIIGNFKDEDTLFDYLGRY